MTGNRIPIVITCTDGEDNREGYSIDDAIRAFNEKGIISLSVGIGNIDVSHRDLSKLASATKGMHIVVSSSAGLTQAFYDFLGFLQFRIKEIAAQLTEHSTKIVLHEIAGYIRPAVKVQFLIDRSWSMFGMRAGEDNLYRYQWTGDKYKFQKAKESILMLLNALSPQVDQASLSSFDSSYYLNVGWTQNFGTIANTLSKMDGGSGTALYKALYYVTRNF